MNDEMRPAAREFSISTGGPFHAIGRRLRVIRPSGEVLTWRLVAFAWMPLVLGAMLRVIFGYRPEPLAFDISVHARFLISLPLVIFSARLLEPQCRAAVVLLYSGKFAERSQLDRVIDDAERLRDNPWIEAVLAGIAVLGGQLVLWGVTGPTGLFTGIEQANLSVSQVWYAGIALPLLQFLALRWLWRWVVWSVILVRVSRLPLATIATHPDRAAGIGFLSGPVTGFAVFELAFASVLAGAWGSQLIDHRVTVPSLFPTLILFVVLASLTALVPLLLFSPHLYRAQRRALLDYNPFALDYVLRFHAKWIERRSDPDLLGTPDLQSLADLGNSYGVIQSTGMFVFGSRKVTELWLGAIVPMLPLVATVVPLEDMFRRLGSMLFGGLL